MRKPGGKAAVFFACCVAFPQTPPQENLPASVEGTVVNAITGEPVLRARVLVQGGERNYGATTDTEGRFSIRGIAPGTYTASASRPGFIMAETPTGERAASLGLKPEQTVRDLRLKLVPLGAITGRVLDSDGEPVESTAVSASGSTAAANPVLTDEQGRFRIGALPPGRYRVNAAGPGMTFLREVRTDGTTPVYHATTWFPNATEEKAAGRIEVRAGAETGGVEIRLIRKSQVRVSGRVSGAVERTTVTLHRGRASSAPVNPDGTFEIWTVDAGKYTVQASAGTLRSAPVEIEVGAADVDHVDLTLMPPFDVIGRVQYDDDEARPPGPDARKPAETPNAQPAAERPAQRQILLTGRSGAVWTAPATVLDDGAFRFANVSPDRYSVRVSWPNAYVQSVHLGPTPAEGPTLDLRYGAGAPVTLVLSSALGEVAGTVAGEPSELEGKVVVLAPEEADAAPPRISRLFNGQYSFRAPPGKYLLVVTDQADVPAATRESREAGEPLELRPREKVTRDLRVRKPM